VFKLEEVDEIIIAKVISSPNINIYKLYFIWLHVQHLNYEDLVNDPFYLRLNKSHYSHRPPECPSAHKSFELPFSLINV
jgi:hypothetical protein